MADDLELARARAKAKLKLRDQVEPDESHGTLATLFHAASQVLNPVGSAVSEGVAKGSFTEGAKALKRNLTPYVETGARMANIPAGVVNETVTAPLVSVASGKDVTAPSVPDYLKALAGYGRSSEEIFNQAGYNPTASKVAGFALDTVSPAAYEAATVKGLQAANKAFVSPALQKLASFFGTRGAGLTVAQREAVANNFPSVSAKVKAYQNAGTPGKGIEGLNQEANNTVAAARDRIAKSALADTEAGKAAVQGQVMDFDPDLYEFWKLQDPSDPATKEALSILEPAHEEWQKSRNAFLTPEQSAHMPIDSRDKVYQDRSRVVSTQTPIVNPDLQGNWFGAMGKLPAPETPVTVNRNRSFIPLEQELAQDPMLALPGMEQRVPAPNLRYTPKNGVIDVAPPMASPRADAADLSRVKKLTQGIADYTGNPLSAIAPKPRGKEAAGFASNLNRNIRSLPEGGKTYADSFDRAAQSFTDEARLDRGMNEAQALQYIESRRAATDAEMVANKYQDPAMANLVNETQAAARYARNARSAPKGTVDTVTRAILGEPAWKLMEFQDFLKRNPTFLSDKLEKPVVGLSRAARTRPLIVSSWDKLNLEDKNE